MHSFHAPYSKSKLARGIHRQGNGKKRKEKTGKEKKEVKKRKQKGYKAKKKGRCTLHSVIKTMPKFKVDS